MQYIVFLVPFLKFYKFICSSLFIYLFFQNYFPSKHLTILTCPTSDRSTERFLQIHMNKADENPYMKKALIFRKMVTNR